MSSRQARCIHSFWTAVEMLLEFDCGFVDEAVLRESHHLDTRHCQFATMNSAHRKAMSRSQAIGTSHLEAYLCLIGVPPR
jgi:hypothetical protein